MKKSHLFLLMCICATTIQHTAKSHASTVIITTSDNQIQSGVDNQGWMSERFTNDNPTNDNYYTGFDENGYSDEDLVRSYFFFDVSSVSGVITSIDLELRRYETFGGIGGIIEFFDVSTSVEDLVATRAGPINESAFNDLGSGNSYGSFNLGEGVTTDILSFTLNDAAITDINVSETYFAIGARVYGYYGAFAFSSEEPGNSNGQLNSTQQIVLVVEPIPIPAAVWLFGSGLLGLVGIARRRSNTSLPIKREQHHSRFHSPLRDLFHRHIDVH